MRFTLGRQLASVPAATISEVVDNTVASPFTFAAGRICHRCFFWERWKIIYQWCMISIVSVTSFFESADDVAADRVWACPLARCVCCGMALACGWGADLFGDILPAGCVDEGHGNVVVLPTKKSCRGSNMMRSGFMANSGLNERVPSWISNSLNLMCSIRKTEWILLDRVICLTYVGAGKPGTLKEPDAVEFQRVTGTEDCQNVAEMFNSCSFPLR